MSVRLIVAGPYHSGSSAISRELRRSGLFVGGRLSVESNFEDGEVVDLHERILADNGLTRLVSGPPLPTVEQRHKQIMRELAERREREHKRWGFSDPRACLFLEEWKEMVPDARVLLVYEEPARSCRALHRQRAESMLGGEGLRMDREFWETPDLALRIWLTHNRALLRFADAHPGDVLAVSPAMMREGLPLVATLNKRWGLGLRRRQDPGPIDEDFAPGVDVRQPTSSQHLVSEAREVWEALEALGEETRSLARMPSSSEELFDEESFYIPSDAYALAMESEFVGYRMHDLQKRLEEAQAERDEIQARLERDGATSLPRQRVEELSRAEQDLRLIVQRFSRSGLAPIFRLKEEFRDLEQRYSK